jgi:DNA-3-methyladenine glycosylase
VPESASVPESAALPESAAVPESAPFSALSAPVQWEPARWELVPREFFARPSLQVAPELLGCVLSHDTEAGRVVAEIVEVEAYNGSLDPASHAFRGRTARNEVMFGEPGHAYVYFTYGMHFCVNLVCQLPGDASALLLRAGWIVDGAELAAARRAPAGSASGGSASAGSALAGSASAGSVSGRRAGLVDAGGSAKRFAQLASGPARLCQALGIARAQNGLDVCDPAGELRILAPPGFAGLPGERIATGPRVGVSTAAEVPWRYWVAGDAAVSAYRAHVPRRPVSN